MRTSLVAVMIVALLMPLSAAAQTDLRASVRTVRVHNGRVGNPADVFRVGEVVGALVEWQEVPASYELVRVWSRRAGRREIPVGVPVHFTVSSSQQGTTSLFTLTGAPAGVYRILIAVVQEGGQVILASHQFQITR